MPGRQAHRLRGWHPASAISTLGLNSDIAVICDLDKLDEAGCRGAPDWVVEVLSRRTTAKDQGEKTRTADVLGGLGRRPRQPVLHL